MGEADFCGQGPGEYGVRRRENSIVWERYAIIYRCLFFSIKIEITVGLVNFELLEAVVKTNYLSSRTSQLVTVQRKWI